MGLCLKVDLETNRGQTNEAYIRLETVRINRVNTRVEYTTSCWINKEAAQAFEKKYIGDPLGSSAGIMTQEVVYYTGPDDVDGTEVTIPNYFTSDIYREVEEVTPIYEEKEVIKTVPYVSFDENGDEVVKEKEVTKVEKVQVDEKVEIKKLFDLTLVDSIFEFTYKQLKKELSKIFPEDKIEIV